MKPPKKNIIIAGHTRESWETKLIADSGLFDLDFYLSQAGTTLTESQAISHYVSTGEKQGLAPTPDFDPKFYSAINYDIKDVGIGPFAHFIKTGKANGRYPNRRHVKAHATELFDSEFSDKSLKLKNIFGQRDPLAQQLDLDPVEAHLAYGWRRGDRLVADFEDLTYMKLYGFDGDFGAPPLMHYLRVGRPAAYFRNTTELEAHSEVAEDAFDEKYYEAEGRLNPNVSAIDEFCSIGWRRGRNPNSRFNTSFYLDMYADIRVQNISPFYHFLTSGKSEGRLTRPKVEEMVIQGARQFDSSLKTVIIAVHEASRTGAPLLALEVGRRMAARFNVMFVMLRGGSLVKDFTKTATFVVAKPGNIIELKYLFKSLAQKFDKPFLIANSVETVEVAEAAAMSGIATVALLHEFADYTLPPGKVARLTMASDVVVTPAHIVAHSAQKEIERVGQFPSNNIKVRQQGKLEELSTDDPRPPLKKQDILDFVGATDESVKIVLGAGFVQARKGVDLFVQTASEVVKKFGSNVRFIWVGKGYEPQKDIMTSVWIHAQMERLGLSKNVYFFAEQPDLEAFYEIADVFYLSSRLDPFPNVAIDAIAAGKKIVCFEQSSGVAEWIADGRIEGALAEYGNCTDAGEKITSLLGTSSYSEKNHVAGTTEFSMNDYVDALLEFGEEAIAIRATIVSDAAEICERKLLDEDYFSASTQSAAPHEEAALKYSAWSQKGLVVWNPRPGFNEGRYRVDNRLVGRSVNVLLHAADKLPEMRTHPFHLIDRLEEPQSSSVRTAIHLHLHYSDLAAEFAERFSRVAPDSDIFITVTNDKARREVDYEFRNHKAGVTVQIVPNRGRDIAPMLHILRQFHKDYDVFGHFHGKKSLFIGGETGTVWRSFLLETLAGTPEAVNKVVGLFDRDPKLGMVFADDRLNSGWTTNKDIAVGVAKDLKLATKLDNYPIYAIGNMFWARPAALLPLLESSLEPTSFPPEPLPDDGTSLHALERILPTIAQSQGFTWCTVRKNGVNRKF